MEVTNQEEAEKAAQAQSMTAEAPTAAAQPVANHSTGR
jgi:hypothetical protein